MADMEVYSQYAEELVTDGGVINQSEYPDVPFWLVCHDCQYKWRNESEPDHYIQGCPECYGVAPSAGVTPFVLKITCSCHYCTDPETNGYAGKVKVDEVHHSSKCYDIVDDEAVEGLCNRYAEPDMWHLVIPGPVVDMEIDL